MTKPTDTATVVYVAVARELLPQLHEWSPPLRVRVAEEEGDVLTLEFRRDSGVMD